MCGPAGYPLPPPGLRLPPIKQPEAGSLLFKFGVDLNISFIKSKGRKSDSKESTAASSVNNNSVT